MGEGVLGFGWGRGEGGKVAFLMGDRGIDATGEGSDRTQSRCPCKDEHDHLPPPTAIAAKGRKNRAAKHNGHHPPALLWSSVAALVWTTIVGLNWGLYCPYCGAV
jgi:hypothetical protein